MFKDGKVHILFCVNKSEFGTKCFVKREQFVLPFINRSTNNEIVPVLVLSFCKYLIFNVVCSGYENSEKYSHIFYRIHILY
nr:MAG TPA: hypothetical protein [Caudoviricetes sp.]